MTSLIVQLVNESAPNCPSHGIFTRHLNACCIQIFEFNYVWRLLLRSIHSLSHQALKQAESFAVLVLAAYQGFRAVSINRCHDTELIVVQWS